MSPTILLLLGVVGRNGRSASSGRARGIKSELGMMEEEGARFPAGLPRSLKPAGMNQRVGSVW